MEEDDEYDEIGRVKMVEARESYALLVPLLIELDTTCLVSPFRASCSIVVVLAAPRPAGRRAVID